MSFANETCISRLRKSRNLATWIYFGGDHLFGKSSFRIQTEIWDIRCSIHFQKCLTNSKITKWWNPWFRRYIHHPVKYIVINNLHLKLCKICICTSNCFDCLTTSVIGEEGIYVFTVKLLNRAIGNMCPKPLITVTLNAVQIIKSCFMLPKVIHRYIFVGCINKISVLQRQTFRYHCQAIFYHSGVLFIIYLHMKSIVLIFCSNHATIRNKGWLRTLTRQMETFSSLLAVCEGNSPVNFRVVSGNV